MADSLFDKRYRYDFIYPRGRSGETLRAVDTLANDLPVVIKRPAPQDAPPIRAGQEVSILNERRALVALAGHPNLPQLLGEGAFLVNGMPHQYIVMERAEGIIIADAVRELAAQGERLPALELLVILDQLLDLLHSAHAKDIIYNDVDAKHLFWNRAAYQLKVIDWGNAIFLEGELTTPQGINRQSDVFQVGQLLYAIVTGGKRADIPRDAGADFALFFGDDARRVHSRLQEIISRAVHPNSRLRYPSIAALRADLSAFRAPLERERNQALAAISERLRRPDLNKEELRTLKNLLEPQLAQDAGYPPAQSAYAEVSDRLRDLSVGADLDAARIYIQNDQWERAQGLLGELRNQAGTQTSGLVNWLHDTSNLILESGQRSATPTLHQAIELMFEGQAHHAAAVLLMDERSDDANRALHWLVAERISSHINDVLLLRPNLYRLTTALSQLAQEGYETREMLRLLSSVEQTLNEMPNAPLRLGGLRDDYRRVVEQLQQVNRLISIFSLQNEQIPNRLMPLNAIERAINAAMTLADSLHVIGRQATASPKAVQNALETVRQIDPPNPLWAALDEFLRGLYARLNSYQSYIPQADGSDLQEWLAQARRELTPYAERLTDDILNEMLRALQETDEAWSQYRVALVEGDRDTATEALFNATSAMAGLSPSLSAWLRNLRAVIEGATYIERHSIPNPIGRVLADAWEAFDRNRLADAERLGMQASELARSEAERRVAERLQDLARLCREWIERGAINSLQRTDALLRQVEALFTPDERKDIETFAAQMPSNETYLKAMGRGLVEGFVRGSSAASRLLYVQYCLSSVLSLHDGRLPDAEFWREAALRTLGENGARHLALRAVDDFIARTLDLRHAQKLLSAIHGKPALGELENTRRQLESNAQARLLLPSANALRELDSAIRDWQSADFRSAGAKIENALRQTEEAERLSHLNLSEMKAWLMELLQTAAELSVHYRDMRALISQTPDQPDARVEELHRDLVRLTSKALGEDYAAQLRQWRDTYEQFVGIYQSDERRSKRLERLDEFFKAMFIDKHPAYALYRHWYGLLERAPEFPAPPTSDPMPRVTPDIAPLDDRNVETPPTRPSLAPTPARLSPAQQAYRRRRIAWGIGGVGALATLITAFVLISQSGGGGNPSPTPSPSPQQVALETTPIPTLAHSATPTPSLTPTPEPPTATPTPSVTPSTTPSPTASFTPSLEAPSPTPTFTALPPEGLQGQQDLIALLSNAPNLPYSPQVFTPVEGGLRLGTGEATGGTILRIAPPADWFELNYGNNAASRVRSTSAELSLRTFNPAVVSAEDVFFGLLLESAEGGDNVGIQVQVIGTNVINLYRVVNNQLSFLSQKSVNVVIARLRIERDLSTGNISLFYNDEVLTEPFAFVAADAPLLPMAWVKEGGVVIGVSNWRVALR